VCVLASGLEVVGVNNEVSDSPCRRTG